MVDVTDGADVAMRLVAGKLFLSHRYLLNSPIGPALVLV
jgi:hypothetical protein